MKQINEAVKIKKPGNIKTNTIIINNEFRSAGKYISEFNGSQLASGIYFARILINDGKDFVAVKKMVLIK